MMNVGNRYLQSIHWQMYVGRWECTPPHRGNPESATAILHIKVENCNNCYLMGAFFSTHRDDDVTNWPT